MQELVGSSLVTTESFIIRYTRKKEEEEEASFKLTQNRISEIKAIIDENRLRDLILFKHTETCV